VAALPPPEVWEPIQAIRRWHDRQIGRWMPHINSLYPFVLAGEVEKAVPLLVEACASVAPFAVTLASFHAFRHPSGTATFWLAPEPVAT